MRAAGRLYSWPLSFFRFRVFRVFRGLSLGAAVSRAKPPLVRLSEMTPGQYADFFAQLSQRTKAKTRDDKPYYNCRFRDNRRSVSFMVWSDSPWFPACEQEWQEGQFYKLRAVYGDTEKYGPQIHELQAIRPVNDADLADGFDPSQLVEHSRFDSEAMFAELKGLAHAHISAAPLRPLVLTTLQRPPAALNP